MVAWAYLGESRAINKSVERGRLAAVLLGKNSPCNVNLTVGGFVFVLM